MLMSAPKNAWMIFPIAGVIAYIVGYVYFRLLGCCVDVIVVVFIMSTTALSLVLGGFELWVASQIGGEAWLYGLGLVSVSVIAFRLFFSGDAQDAVSNAAGCIEAACECINADFSLLWEPMIALAIRTSVLLSLLVTLLLLVTCGSPRQLPGGGVRKEFEFSTWLRVYIGFVCFMLLWLMEMCTSSSQYVLAWVTERWYFTPYVNDQKLEWKRNAVCRGYVHMVRRHLGTVALGSLLILLIRIPRVFLKIISIFTSMARSTRLPLCVCIASSCCWPCSWLSDKLDHVSKNAYLGVALQSESFIRAGISAYHTLHNTESAKKVAMLNGMQGFFQVGGLMAITAASGMGTLVATEVFNFFGPDIKIRNAVIAIATATGFPIGLGYMTLFDTVGDTILYCWAVQQRRFEYHARHSQLRGRDLEDASFTGYITSYFIAPDDGDECFKKVNYAPAALRELVLGRKRKMAILPCLE